MYFLRPSFAFVNTFKTFASRNNIFQYGKTVVKRHFADKKYSDLKKMLEEKSRFEKNFKTPEDVLMFSYKGKEMKHTVIIVGGYIATVMLLNSAHVVYLSWNTASPTANENQKWWNKISSSQKAKYAIIVTLILSAFVIPWMSRFYVRKVVKSLTLVRGGKSVRIETYRAFGASKIIEANLEHVTAGFGPEQTVGDYVIKVKGENFGYLLDFRDGIIHDREMFFNTVGIARSFEKKK